MSEKAQRIAEERYTLDVTPGGVAIAAASATGAARAIASLGQLVRWDGGAEAAVLDRVPVHIVDEPELAWRGLMVDGMSRAEAAACVLPIGVAKAPHNSTSSALLCLY